MPDQTPLEAFKAVLTGTAFDVPRRTGRIMCGGIWLGGMPGGIIWGGICPGGIWLGGMPGGCPPIGL